MTQVLNSFDPPLQNYSFLPVTILLDPYVLSTLILCLKGYVVVFMGIMSEENGHVAPYIMIYVSLT